MVQHVALEVRREDAEACAAFYELLGFARVRPPDSLAERALWVERRGTQIHLFFAAEPTIPSQGHVAVVVADFDQAWAALERAGHDPERRAAHWGAPRGFVRDPAGHRVEVMASAPTA